MARPKRQPICAPDVALQSRLTQCPLGLRADYIAERLNNRPDDMIEFLYHAERCLECREAIGKARKQPKYYRKTKADLKELEKLAATVQ